MEVQLGTTTYPYLKTVAQGRQIREEVQQIKLPESFPDIGRVVDCWGQALIRGKEWRNDGIRVSGGVMVWILYAPEDGSELKSVEGWIPFQGKWEIRDSKRDGTICVNAYIQNMDARSISARKLMVRCGISMSVEALEPDAVQLMQPETAQEGIQLLTNIYPLTVPLEAGEKLVQLEETLDRKAPFDGTSRILFCRTEPVIQESKILANRLVFRGKVILHLIYSGESGRCELFSGEIPFSQYTDLDHEFTESAAASLQPVVTVSEVEFDETTGLNCKCGIAVQYVVYDRRNLAVVEDAYCPGRQVDLIREDLSIPVRLDVLRHEFQQEAKVENCGNVILPLWDGDAPDVMQVAETAEIRNSGVFRLLHQDQDGNCQVLSCGAEDTIRIGSDPDNQLRVNLCAVDGPVITASGDGVSLAAKVQAEVHVLSEQEFSMVTGITLGEPIHQNPNRPSLILCRAGGANLWQIAKRYGSTVEALKAANALAEEPEPDRLLLIPIA